MTKEYYLDFDNKDRFIEGWSSLPIEGVAEVLKTENELPELFLLGYYRLDEDFNLVYDETKILREEKEIAIEESRERAKLKSSLPIEIAIRGEAFLWESTEQSKSFLERSYGLVTRGLIRDGIMFTLLEKETGNTTLKTLSKTNIEELWLLEFLQEEEARGEHSLRTTEIEQVKTLEELKKITG